MALRSTYTQMFPPHPGFTEKDVTAQNGRVFIVTGGNSGIGFELCKLLYSTGASVYLAARSKEKADSAIESILSSVQPPTEPGAIHFLPLDLSDLPSIRSAAALFQSRELRLDVLWNNAGMGGNRLPLGTRTEQGLEAMVGINCVGPHLLTVLLLPQLRAAGAGARVVWTSSYLAEKAPARGGIDFGALEAGLPDSISNYAVSKLGNFFLARELARREPWLRSVAANPGNVVAQSYDGTGRATMWLLRRVLLRDTVFGAYTQLFAGLSDEVAEAENGTYVIPFGRLRPEFPRADVVEAMKPEEEGGLGYAKRFWEWCEEQWQSPA